MAQRLIAGFACPIGSSPVRDERTRRSLVAISQCFPRHFLKKTPEITHFTLGNFTRKSRMGARYYWHPTSQASPCVIIPMVC